MSRAHKYGVAAKKLRTLEDGTVFDSKKEMETWYSLQLIERAGQISNLKRQVSFPLHAWDEEHRAAIRVSTYVADFTYTDDKGENVVADAKGVLTPMYRLKRAWLKAQYGIVIEEL